MRAVLLVCVLSDSDSASAQTAGAAPPPESPIPLPAGALSLPAPGLAPGDDVQRRGSDVTIETLFPADAPRLPKGWSFRFESPAACMTCPDRLGAGGVPNANAPWRVSGALDWRGESAAFGLAVTGQRGARLPLYMTPPTGGIQPPATASDAVLSDTRTRWQLTLNGERIIWTSPGGNTVSLFGQAHLPIGTTGRKAKTEDVSTISPRAFLGGFRVRF